MIRLVRTHPRLRTRAVLGGLGFASVPGAALAKPDSTIVLTTGDGGGLMALADLESAVRVAGGRGAVGAGAGGRGADRPDGVADADRGAEDQGERQALQEAVADAEVDLVAFEKDKVKGAVRTDFILSAEIIAITLGIVSESPLLQQVVVLSGIAIVMTVGVYGFVAMIVKILIFEDLLGIK